MSDYKKKRNGLNVFYTGNINMSLLNVMFKSKMVTRVWKVTESWRCPEISSKLTGYYSGAWLESGHWRMTRRVC